ncbi:MAG: tetratricopeptide repeat protein [Leptolyngbyaceae cyanobacterium SL_1_1]|nr:tetratricopeptide repeat protein [Leptolyngbyaceae cyanobacterium RM2_2_21]NJN04456.1 tetratricopeptide repeat protein [Leptolyngbyaceae cyanobacterium RM1_1_2]NJO10063.1 tetratricopeptide repeat protein [Leptolyngbyaceae cyanobacterium SL_1_1]
MKRYEKALEDFSRAIEIDPEYDWAIASRGKTYHSMKRYKEALEDFSRAIEIDSEYEWAIGERGEIYRLLNRHEEAIADFNRVTEINPDYSCHNEWGLVLSYQGKYSEAIEIYRQSLKKDSDSYSIIYNIAIATVRWKSLINAQLQVDIAYRTLSKIIATEHRGAAFYGLGGLKAVAGKSDEALDLLKQAIASDRSALIWARQDIAWLDLRSDTRFQELIS